MNERILELAKKSGLKFPSETALSPVELEFARLIVAECASIVDTYGRWILYDKLAVKIKQHFGVTYD